MEFGIYIDTNLFFSPSGSGFYLLILHTLTGRKLEENPVTESGVALILTRRSVKLKLMLFEDPE